MLDAYATQSNYIEHLLPIWEGLGDQMGRFYITGGLEHEPELTTGIPGRTWAAPNPGGPLLVAGYKDAAVVTRPYIYLEHGAGQSYTGDARSAEHPTYAGAPGHQRAVLFLCPHENVAERWEARYPHTRTAVVGVPKLDRLHRHFAAAPWTPPTTRTPTVAITFHADNIICPESRSAFGHYADGLPAVVGDLARQGITTIGHGHPSLWRTLGPYWTRIGVEPVRSFEAVCRRADLLVADNTSALPEFASLGKPIVFLDAPGYRRTVRHGGRFWDWPTGQISVAGSTELAEAVTYMLADPAPEREAREAMVDSIYCATDGKATERAVAACLAVAPVQGPQRGAMYIP